MRRLTKRDKKTGRAYFPECFKEPCGGCGCAKENCDFLERVCEALCAYEDTGLSPSGVELEKTVNKMRNERKSENE